MVTEADRTTIDEYFHFRHVCDEDDKFLWFFRRTLNRAYPRYQKLVELELSEIPDLIDYRRAIHNEVVGSVTDNGTQEATTKSNGTTSGTTSDTTTTKNEGTTGIDGTNTTKHTGTVGVEHTGQSSESTTDKDITEQKTSAYHKEISRALPQSTNGASVSGANMSLDWTYGTSQGQTEDNGGKTQRDGTGSKTGSDSATDTTTHNTTDTTTSKSTTTDESESNTTSSGQTSSTTQGSVTQSSESAKTTASTTNGDTVESGQSEIETAIRSKIRDYIRNSISIDWLRRELEPCFMGVFEV